MVIPMPPQFTAREGDKSFKLTCRARAKPKPTVTWWQNGREINVDSGLFRVETREHLEDADVSMIQTTLHFEAISRTPTNTLTANDRGRYVCVFDNGLGSSKSESVLRIEHSPVVRHTYNRVAFDYSETAVLQCKMSAYPQPKFEWFFRGKLLDYGERYSTNITDVGDDIYVGVLSVRNTREQDYGDYTCRAWNSIGDDDEKTIIKLVRKSAPETPGQLEVLEVLSDSVTLRWLDGFNGGFGNTEFIVSYSDGERWRNESCRSINPCKITGLESRKEYQFRVLAVNPRGYSPYSASVKTTTKVNLKDMPNAFDSAFDREKSTLFFRVEPHIALKLVAKIEVRTENSPDWKHHTTVPIISDYERVYLKSPLEEISDIRIVLCLQSNESWCGYEHLVKMDSISYAKESKGSAADSLIAVVTISAIMAGAAAVFLVCCCWRKRDKSTKKDYEMESSGARSKVNTISPPFYPGHDNKGELILLLSLLSR